LETEGPLGDCFRAAQALYPPECLVPLEPLSPEHGSRLLDSWLAEATRTQQPAQRELVLGTVAACPRPLFLKLAFEERDGGNRSTAGGSRDIPGCFMTSLTAGARQQSRSGAGRAGAAAMGAGRYGLTEDCWECCPPTPVMADFRRRSPESPASDRLPWVVWSRLYHDLEPYLTERRADGAALLSFYHRQVGEAVAARFLSGDDAVQAHRRLAAFFGARPTYLRRADGVDVPDRRKASELAYQQVRGRMWDELEATLAADLDFLEAKCAAGQVFELAADYAAAVLRMPADHLGRRTLRCWKRRCERTSTSSPATPRRLFQCLWNRAWWYDSPEAGAHYEAPADGWPTEGPPWSRPVLAPLLERWRAEKERRKPRFVWLRSLRPPDVHLGTPHRAVFRGHEAKVGGVAVSADGHVIVSGSDDRTVRVWDATGGQRSPCSAVTRVGQCRRLFRRWPGDPVRLWRPHGACLGCRGGPGAGCPARTHRRGHRGAVSPGGLLIVSGSNDTTVRLWAPSGWAEAAVLSGHRDKVTSVAVSRTATRRLGVVRQDRDRLGHRDGPASAHARGATAS
jgi:hypothetical protein